MNENLYNKILEALERDPSFINKLENILSKDAIEAYNNINKIDKLISKALDHLNNQNLEEAQNIEIQITHLLEQNQTLINEMDNKV